MSRLISTVGKVFIVRRKRGGDDESANTTTGNPAAPSLPIKTSAATNQGTSRSAAQVANSASVSNAETSDDGRGRRVLEYVTVGLTVAEHVVGPIPIAGSPLKAAIGSLLDILKASDKFFQNKEDIESLKERLHLLENHISTVPTTDALAISKLRDNLTEQLNGTLAKLDRLRNMALTRKFLQYLTVAKIIEGCSKDIGFYLSMYSTLSVMHTESSLQQMKTNTQRSLLEMKTNTETSLGQIKELLLTLSPQHTVITGVVLIDATGRKYEVPMDLAKSYEMFTNTMGLFFKTNTLEARIQRRYMNGRKYDLCIDGGDQVVTIGGEHEWPVVQPGTTIVMRALLKCEQVLEQYECPRCGTLNKQPLHRGPSIDCQGCESRLQISISIFSDWYQLDHEELLDDVSHDKQMGVLRNFHLQVFKFTPKT